MFSKFHISGVFLLVLGISSTNGNTRVDITLSASELPIMDPFNGYPDPYAVVYYSFSPALPYLLIGETAYFDDTQECEWTEVFTFDYINPGSAQRVKITIMDDDFDGDDEIGSIEFFLYDLVTSFEQRLERNITGSTNQGILVIKAVVNGTSTHNVD